jgi:hypothetical protein
MESGKVTDMCNDDVVDMATKRVATFTLLRITSITVDRIIEDIAAQYAYGLAKHAKRAYITAFIIAWKDRRGY